MISARSERAYSRSILKRLKMFKTLSSANTFRIRLKNISSDNTHLCFSSRRAHKIEEEIQIYSQLCVFTFASAQKRKSCFFAQNTSDKKFQNFDRFLAQKWSNNTDDDDGGAVLKLRKEDDASMVLFVYTVFFTSAVTMYSCYYINTLKLLLLL